MLFSACASISIGGRTRIEIPSQTDNKQLSAQNNRNPDTAHSFFSFPSCRMEAERLQPEYMLHVFGDLVYVGKILGLKLHAISVKFRLKSINA